MSTLNHVLRSMKELIDEALGRPVPLVRGHAAGRGGVRPVDVLEEPRLIEQPERAGAED
jgi:hypothetical protein